MASSDTGVPPEPDDSEHDMKLALEEAKAKYA
jgi:hypothetical protein